MARNSRWGICRMLCESARHGTLRSEDARRWADILSRHAVGRALCLDESCPRKTGDRAESVGYSPGSGISGNTPGCDSSQIRISGSGSAGIAAGMASLLDERVRSVLARRTITSYQSIVDAENYSVSLDWFVTGILLHFDLPDILACIHPRPVWIYDAVDADGKPIPESAVHNSFLRRVPENSPVYGTLRFGVGPEKEEDLYSQWLRIT